MRIRALSWPVYALGKPPKLNTEPWSASDAWIWMLFAWRGGVLDCGPAPQADTVALADAPVNFEVGQQVAWWGCVNGHVVETVGRAPQVCPECGAGPRKSVGGTMTVTGVDMSAGTITVEGAS